MLLITILMLIIVIFLWGILGVIKLRIYFKYLDIQEKKSFLEKLFEIIKLKEK